MDVHRNCLVIDDDKIALKLAATCCHELGLKVYIADKPVEAFDELKRRRYRLIVVDHHVHGRAAISSYCSSKNNDQYTKFLRTIFKTLTINVSSNSKIVGFVKKITVSSCFEVNKQTSVSAVLIYFFRYPSLVDCHVAVAKE